RTFVETAAPQIASGRDGGTVASWDIGAAYLLTNDWQLGVRAATSATRATPSSQLLFELAGRF
ncbi:MAG TPA: transporter, partial [Burkholderiales bacterium]|nr:transporter [Burkholderiales bacterium]